MNIGNLPKEAEAFKLDKWYVGVQILKRPPYRYDVFRPYLYLYFFKITKEQYDKRQEGEIVEHTGFRKEFISPIGIIFEIHR